MVNTFLVANSKGLQVLLEAQRLEAQQSCSASSVVRNSVSGSSVARCSVIRNQQLEASLESPTSETRNLPSELGRN